MECLQYICLQYINILHSVVERRFIVAGVQSSSLGEAGDERLLLRDSGDSGDSGDCADNGDSADSGDSAHSGIYIYAAVWAKELAALSSGKSDYKRQKLQCKTVHIMIGSGCVPITHHKIIMHYTASTIFYITVFWKPYVRI